MSLRVEVVDEVGAFDRMREAWNAAVAESLDPNVFLTWEWLRTWWGHFGEPDPTARLHVAVVHDGGGLVALAPLYVSRRGVGPARSTLLRAVSYDAGDYGGIVVLRRPEEAVAALVAHFGELVAGHEVSTVVLSRLTSDSSFLSGLRAVFDPGDGAAADRVLGVHEARLDEGCPFADVREGYDLARRARKHRVRQRMGRMAARHRVGFATHTGTDLEEGLQDLVAVHARRWAGRSGEVQGLLADARREAFLLDAVRALDGAGWVRLATLRADDRPAAVELDFEFARRLLLFKGAFDPAFAEFAPGQLLLHRTFEDGIARGVEELDFMRGDHAYKRAWATGDRHLVTVTLARPGWSGRLATRRHRLSRALVARLRWRPPGAAGDLRPGLRAARVSAGGQRSSWPRPVRPSMSSRAASR